MRQRTRARPRALPQAKRHASFHSLVKSLRSSPQQSVDEFADLDAADPEEDLVVGLAPEPTDILWENLEVSRHARLQAQYAPRFIVQPALVFRAKAALSNLF